MLLLPPEHADIDTPTGPMRVHVLRPDHPGPLPGVVMFSEIYQVTGPIHRTAALLAGQGYVVTLPEIYHAYEAPGVAYNYDAAGTERGNTLKTTKPLGAYDHDARAALDFLAKHPACNGRLGTLGICIGGHLAFRCAMNPDVQAGACYYATDIHSRSLGAGKNDDSLDRMDQIPGEMLMVFGRQDPHVPAEGRRAIYDAMTLADVDFTWHEFNGQHAFMRDEGHRYDPAIARLVYELTFDLFARRLKP